MFSISFSICVCRVSICVSYKAPGKKAKHQFCVP